MDAAESELSGDVDPQVASGCIRYRIWPAWRHKIRTLLAVAFVIGSTVGVSYAYESPLWATVTFLGLTAALAIFFFPTMVTLDGPVLHLRQLGAPRTHDLRQFKRVEVHEGLLPRAEMGLSSSVSALDHVKGTTVPLPANPTVRDQVVVHLRRWVGRAPSGIFEMDADHAPEDHSMAEAS